MGQAVGSTCLLHVGTDFFGIIHAEMATICDIPTASLHVAKGVLVVH